MSSPKCGVCHEQDFKYKCPVCELRYCSLVCYKSHKTSHNDTEATVIQQQHQQAKRDRPGTTQRIPKVDFTSFEKDPDFVRLLARYPLLKSQLQLAYGLTLEPGPDEKWTWNKQPLLGALDPSPSQSQRSHRGRVRGRGRGNHEYNGRASGARGGRGMRGTFRGRGNGNGNFSEPPEDRQHGSWTQEKGNKEALLAIKKTGDGRGGQGDIEEERAEGMREFVELCGMRFGPEGRREEEVEG